MQLKTLIIAIFLCLLFSLTGCQKQGQLIIDYEIHHGAYWNETYEKFAFIASTKAYTKPHSFERMPEGGISDYLHRDVSLYLFSSSTQKLLKIISFNDLMQVLNTSRIRWNSQIFIHDSVIYYHVSPITDWSVYLNKKNNKNPSQINKLKEKYSNSYYAFHLNNHAIKTIESEHFKKLFTKCQERNLSLAEIYTQVSEVPLVQWGLNVQEIFPKSNDEYITETIYLRNECQLTRRAVCEQIIAEMETDQIRALIYDMEAYKTQLKGLNRKEYEIYSQKIRNMLQKLAYNESEPDNP